MSRDRDTRRSTLRTDRMVEVRLQSIHDIAGLGMVVPEHAEVTDTDRGHQRAYHLVELARRRSENTPERRVSHVQERFDGRLDRRVSSRITPSLALSHRSYDSSFSV